MFSIGTRVMFSRAFLRSTGQLTGEVPFKRGTVKALEPLGANVLAYIHWDNGDCGRVLTSNLMREDRRHLEAV